MKIEILPDADAVARQAAEAIAADARASVLARGRFVMAVSGGHTPWQMLRALANEDVPWENLHVAQVDERVAPEGDPDRNLSHLRESLLEHAPLRPEQILAMPVEWPDLDAAAKGYARDSTKNCRHAAGARSRPSRSWTRRPHCLTGARRSGAQCYRLRCRANGCLSRTAPDDVDLSYAQSVP